eukprot:scaffold254_cov156-Skeletonema_menzelii.AAC.3
MEINREETRKQLSITLVPVLLNLKKDSRRLTYNMTHVTEGRPNADTIIKHNKNRSILIRKKDIMSDKRPDRTTMEGMIWNANRSVGSGVIIGHNPEDDSWTPPSAVSVGGIGFGLVAGSEVKEHRTVMGTGLSTAPGFQKYKKEARTGKEKRTKLRGHWHQNRAKSIVSD